MNEMSILAWLTAGLTALGVGLLAHGLTGLLSDGLYRFRHRRSRTARLLLFAEGAQKQSAPQARASAADLMPDEVPWGAVYAASAALAAGLYLWSGQRLALGLALLPLGVRMWRQSMTQRAMLADVWQFLMDVRLRLTVEGSLSRSLQVSARESNTRMARVVSRYLDGGYEGDGLALLEQIAADTGVSLLGDLAARTQAAAAGTLELDDALRQSMQRMHAELSTRKREQLQQIPSRLILFVFPTLLGLINAGRKGTKQGREYCGNAFSGRYRGAHYPLRHYRSDWQGRRRRQGRGKRRRPGAGGVPPVRRKWPVRWG